MKQASEWNAEFKWRNIHAAVHRRPNDKDDLGNVMPGSYRLSYAGGYSPWLSYRSIERAVRILLNETADEECRTAHLKEQLDFYFQQYGLFFFLVERLNCHMEMGSSISVEVKGQSPSLRIFECCAEDYYGKFLPWLNALCIERGLAPIF